MEYSAPAGRGTTEPFRSEIREHLKGRTEALENLAVELLARGLSVREIEDAFRDETGRLLLSKTAVSEIGERLWADYQEFATRDLGEYEIAYPVRRRHRRTQPPRAEARAGAGRLGIYRIRRQSASASDGGFPGGRRDGERLLPGHRGGRVRRSAARLRRCSRRDQAIETCFPRSEH
ncbi:transposase [Mesorhizobium sp. M0915]